MPKYLFEYAIAGEKTIEAENKDQARELFEMHSKDDLAAEGELELLSGPETKEERDAGIALYRFGLTEAARDLGIN